jgi:hypothetical protein
MTRRTLEFRGTIRNFEAHIFYSSVAHPYWMFERERDGQRQAAHFWKLSNSNLQPRQMIGFSASGMAGYKIFRTNHNIGSVGAYTVRKKLRRNF